MAQIAAAKGTSSPEGLRQVNVTRTCAKCGSDKTAMSRGKYPKWYKVESKDGTTVYHCHKCAAESWNKRRIVFKGKQVYLDKNPRTGYCQNPNCPKKGKKQKTDMHHTHYDETDPLKDAIELCDSCHKSTGFTYGKQQRDEEQDSVAGGDGSEVVIAEAA